MAEFSNGNNLIIGLGGTGGRVLRELRKRMFDENINEAKGIAFLYIDSSRELVDAKDSSFYLSEFVDLCLKRKTAYDIADQIDQFPHLANIDNGAELLRNYKEGFGAQQNRQLGRILLLAHSSYYSSAIHNAINRLFDNFQNKLTITIVTGLSGGTGSGILIDIITCIYKEFQVIDIDLNVIGVLPYVPLPSPTYDAGRYYANAYATLRELNALNTGNYPLEDNIKKTIKRFNLHLYGNVTEDGENITPEHLNQIISSALFERYFGTPTRSLLRFNEIAMYESTPEYEDDLPVHMKCVFATGLRKIVYPYSKILRRLSYDLAIQACNKLLYNNYVLLESDNMIENIIHNKMNVEQACENIRTFREAKGYVDERRNTHKLFGDRVYILKLLGISDNQLTLREDPLLPDNLHKPYRNYFIRYAEKFEAIIMGLNKKSAFWYLYEFQNIKFHNGKPTGDMRKCLEYIKSLPIHTFELFRDDHSVPTDIKRFAYLQDFSHHIYERDIETYFSEIRAEGLSNDIISHMEKLLMEEIKNNKASLDEVTSLITDIESYLSGKLQSCDDEIKKSEDTIRNLQVELEGLFNTCASLSLIQRILLPRDKMCAMIDGLFGMLTMEKLSLLGKRFKKDILPLLIQGCGQMHNDFLYTRNKVFHTVRIMIDKTSLMKFPEKIDEAFKNPVTEIYLEKDYHNLLEKILSDKYSLDRLLVDIMFDGDHQQSFSSLNSYVNIAIDNWYLDIEKKMKHDSQIRYENIYEACDKYIGKGQIIDFIRLLLHKSGTLLPLNSIECGRIPSGRKNNTHSPIMKATIVKRPLIDTEPSEMIESVIKEEDLRINNISVEDDGHPAELTVMTVCTNFALRTIAVLPKLKHQYELLMKQDNQRAVNTLHIEDSCADLPLLEI